MKIDVQKRLLKKVLMILSYLFIPAYSSQLITTNYISTTIRKK